MFMRPKNGPSKAERPVLRKSQRMLAGTEKHLPAEAVVIVIAVAVPTAIIVSIIVAVPVIITIAVVVAIPIPVAVAIKVVAVITAYKGPASRNPIAVGVISSNPRISGARAGRNIC